MRQYLDSHILAKNHNEMGIAFSVITPLGNKYNSAGNGAFNVFKAVR